MESYHGAVLSPTDAVILLEAARQRLIPKITRRLKDHERQQIKTGSIFIWNEKEAKMRRWTDGRSWSASRVTGAFLTYREMESSNNEDSNDFRYKNDGLIKQSFSLTTLKGEKFHLISYTTTKEFSTSKFMNKTPSNDPILKDIKIPKNVYPQHAFLDSKESSSSIISSPTSSASSPLEDIASPTPILPQNPRHFTQELTIPRSTIQSTSSINNNIQLPPLNLNNLRGGVDYDGRALNALDRWSFNY